jgi:CheY-like chemotaxis protein
LLRQILHIIILEKDPDFRTLLKEIFSNLSKRLAVVYNIFEAGDFSDLQLFANEQPDAILMSYNFVLENPEGLNTIFTENPNCKLILSLSDNGTESIKNVIEIFNNYPSINFFNYILKEDYSYDLVVLLIKKLSE